jgi:hypothetical protein
MRDTDYAREEATAAVDEFRVERIFVKAENQIEIRFSWWPDGKMANRPLDLPEPMLLDLIKEGIRQRVFSGAFLSALGRLLAEHATYPDAA